MKLELTTNELDKIEYFSSIMLLGVIEAILNEKISIDEAEKIFFSPSIADKLERMGIDHSIIQAIWLGTELEDIYSLIPEKLNESLLEIKNILLTKILSYKFDLYNYLIDDMSINLSSNHYQIITPFPDDKDVILED
ncbi:MAG: DUF3969 family protein [Gilliamella sp.]|uniref:DUF3969 family protein n=1 Tax=unclassified Gilliamella TaxID=2685620 RepID=UPI00080DBBC6|nr:MULTISPECIES: DUF3969 family protein [Gilliamella]MCO6551427.1 DUF3969 family protein [Gilliamella sp.]OCG35830.1 hypothetical protein A9G32_06295 [Gilliamella apicola]OCG48731.1 hypothetical protein A9G26_10055 [Gilliamella apicola]OCG48856.1 hypothetical protein A9G27_03720 [Gilliamella apicola]